MYSTITFGIILITCIISWVSFKNYNLKSKLILSPSRVLKQKEIWLLFTHAFIHADFLHLFFNSTWSIVFFGFHQIGLALLNLLIILFFIFILMKKYFAIDKISFYLMIPYATWSSFALVLNSAIFLLN